MQELTVRKLLAATLLCSVGILAIPAANAVTVTVSTSDQQIFPGADNQGWLSTTEANFFIGNDNYYTGEGDSFRSFFSFDLSGISGTVTAAVFEVQRYLQPTALTLTLFDVSTSASALADMRQDLADPTAFADLGSGTSYGSFALATGLPADILSFPLNAAAISDIAAHIGVDYFTIGAAALSGGIVFSTSNDEPEGVQRLVLNVTQPTSVPEPGTLGLFAGGLLAFVLSRKRRSARKNSITPIAGR